MKKTIFNFTSEPLTFNKTSFHIWYNLRNILLEKDDLVEHVPDKLMIKKFNGDLYGYLSSLDLDTSLHPVIMLLSGYKSTKDFGFNKNIIYLPNNANYLIEKIKDLEL